MTKHNLSRLISALIFSAIFTLALFSLVTVAFAVEAPPAAPKITPTNISQEVQLQAPLPGDKEGITKIGPGAEGGGGYIINYVTTIYGYVAGLAGLLAVLMMVFGGFQVMTSGTNPAGVSAGKEKIVNAVGGLILLLVSALLLYTINPNAFTIFEAPPPPEQAAP